MQWTDFVKRTLREGTCRVIFMKRDGTLREMTCTTNTDLIPEEHRPTGIKPTVGDFQATYRVYDLEKEAWRSFRYDSITTFAPPEESEAVAEVWTCLEDGHLADDALPYWLVLVKVDA